MRLSLPSVLEPFSLRSAGDVNSLFTSFEDMFPIDGGNLAEEGLDASCFVDQVHGRRLKTISDNTRIALPVSPGFTTFAMGSSFQTSPIGAVSSRRLLRITSCVYFESAVGQHGLPSALQMRHEYDVGAGTAVPFASTARKDVATIASGDESRRHATVAIESWMFGPITNLLWVRLAYQLAGAVSAYPSKASLLVDAFDNFEVLP